MLRPSVLLLTLVVFFGCAICEAQIMQGPIITQFPRPADSAPPPKVDPETEKKALDLVETLSEQVLNLHASANRIRAESEVADLLWVRDEKRARTLFTAAVTQLTNQISDLDYSDPEVYQEMQRITLSRQELVMRIAPHDADLAISALQLTRLQTDNRSRYGGNWTANNEANLEMMLASVIAAKDPAAALKLARTSPRSPRRVSTRRSWHGLRMTMSLATPNSPTTHGTCWFLLSRRRPTKIRIAIC